MENEVSPIKNMEMPELMSRIQHIENKVDLINMKLQSEPGLPGFEFFIDLADLQERYDKALAVFAIDSQPNRGDPIWGRS